MLFKSVPSMHDMYDISCYPINYVIHMVLMILADFAMKSFIQQGGYIALKWVKISSFFPH